MSKKTFDIIMMAALLTINLTFCYFSSQAMHPSGIWLPIGSVIIATSVFIVAIYDTRRDASFKYFGIYTMLILPILNVAISIAILFTFCVVKSIEIFTKFRNSLK